MSNVEEYNFHLRNEYNVIDITRHIHPTALIDPRAILEKNVTIGPYTAIGPNVHIGKDTIVGAHVVIEGCTTIGNKNEISTGAIIGNKPQDLKYRGEESFVEIGNHNIIREYATINRGTKGGGRYYHYW
jgi:UDP-N-acetylglucosamine acyltransferase